MGDDDDEDDGDDGDDAFFYDDMCCSRGREKATKKGNRDRGNEEADCARKQMCRKQRPCRQPLTPSISENIAKWEKRERQKESEGCGAAVEGYLE